MTKTFSFLCLFTAIGCSSVTYTSHDTIPVVFRPVAEHTRDISIDVSKEYYLWGLIPDTRELRLDKEFARRGVNSVAEVQIKEKSTPRDYAWSLFTLGFYMPKTYVLSGKTVEGKRSRLIK